MLDRFVGPLASPFANKLFLKLKTAGIGFQKSIVVAILAAGTGCFLAGMQIYAGALIFLLLAKLMGASAFSDATTTKKSFCVVAVDIITLSAFGFFLALGQMQTSTAAAFLILSLCIVGISRTGQIFLNVPQRHFTGQTESILFLLSCCLYPQGFAAIAAFFGILWMVGSAIQIVTIVRQN